MKRKRKGGRISQGQNGDPSRGDNPAEQIQTKKDLPLNEALQPKPRRGRCRADQGKERSTATIYVATYNVRSLAHSHDLKRLQEQLREIIKWNIVGTSETKRKGEGLTELEDGTWMYYKAAKTEDAKNRKGMALLVHKDFKDYIESFQIHSDRIISCKIRLQEESLQIIQVYAPTKDYEDTDVEKFYEDLDNAVNRKECKQHIIMGDFNAKIGIKEKNENLEWIGPRGIGIRNDRGERLLDFAANNKLFVTNTFFQKPASHYWTWESPGGAYHNQIDFILADEKSTIFTTLKSLPTSTSGATIEWSEEK